MLDQKQLEHVEYFSCLSRMVTKWCKMCMLHSIQDCHGTSSNQQDECPICQQIGLIFREGTIKVLRLEHSLNGAETGTLWTVDQKYLESYEMWCSWRMEGSVGPIVWEIKYDIESRKEGRNILHIILKTGKANWIGHILLRNCLLKHVT
jgi:hypothetical protein